MSGRNAKLIHAYAHLPKFWVRALGERKAKRLWKSMTGRERGRLRARIEKTLVTYKPKYGYAE